MYTVLYVDDEPSLLEIGKLFLEQEGHFRVDTITSAPAALALMNTRTYDAIIADYQMPGMDGIEFLKKVRNSGNIIPFILFTGRGREEIVIQALNEGADFYLQKGGEPVAQFTELSHQIRQAVQQRKAEISIRDLERREADIINFLPDATFAIDRSGHIIAWNHAIEEMTGLTAGEMLGKGDFEYAIPFYGQRQPILIDLIYEPDEVIAGKYAHIVRKKDVLIADTSLPRPRGKQLTLMGKASPLYNQQGEVIGAIESIRDITEMKKAEESLRESEDQFAAFMDHLPVTAFIKDEKSINLFVNRRMEKIFGAGSWIGKTVRELFPDEAAEKMIEDDRQTLRDGFRKTIETLTGSDGTTRMYETNKFRIDRENKPPLIGGFAIDITEQKEAETALNESEMRFRKIFENSPLGMTLVTPDFRFYSVNPAWLAMTGYPEDDLLKMSFKDITLPEHLAGDLEHMKELADGAIPVYTTEKKYRRKDGTILWGLIKVTTIRDQQGTLRYFAAQIEDITERRRAEEELRKSEERYRHVVEDQTEFISRFLPDGTHVFVNEAYCRYFGLERGQILGNRFRPDMPAEDRNRLRQFLASLTPDHPVDSIEHRIIMPDGSIRWQRWTDRAIFDPSGTVTEYQSVGRDITGMKETEVALRESEAKYRTVIDQSQNGIIITRDGRLIFHNTAFATMTGFSSAELEDRDIAGLVAPEDREMVMTRHRERLRGRTLPELYDFSLLHCDGTSRIHVTMNVTSATIGGKPTLIGTLHNITEERKREEALRESEDRFRRLISRSFDAVLVHRDGRIVIANEAAALILGAPSAADLIGRPLLDLVHPEFRPMVTDRIRQMISSPGGTVPLVEEKFMRDDGSAVDVEVMATATRHGGAPAVMVVFRDITVRKQVEEVLRKSEAHLKRAEEIGRSGSWEFRLSENMVHASMGARALYGLEGTQWTIDEVRKIPLPEYRPLLDKAMQDLIAGKSPYNIEFRIKRRTDGAFLVIHSLAEYDPAHNVVFGVIHDITGRKQAEEELTFRNLILSTQQEASPDGILIVDENNRILNYNRKFTEIWRIPEHLIASRTDEPVLQYVVGQNAYPEAFLSRVRYLYDHKDEKSSEELILRDGRVLERFSTPILGDQGKYYGRVWYFRDITGRRKAEEALRDVNKKLNLLSMITRHDINNQLTLLQAHLKILEKTQRDPTCAPQFRKVAAAAERIASMIRFTQEYEEIGVNTPLWQDCRTLVDRAAAQLPPGDIRVENNLRAGTGIFADPQIVNVFYNLMDNAVRYGGKITTIRFSLQESGEEYRIVCDDDGEGIPDDEKERIFEQKFGRNTGLGLFLSREILGITGITIRENGEQGKGARFEILIPKDAYRSGHE